MKRLLCCALIIVLSGCIPIGFQANTRSVAPSDRTEALAPGAPSSLFLY
jgi:hypothetical protein